MSVYGVDYPEPPDPGPYDDYPEPPDRGVEPGPSRRRSSEDHLLAVDPFGETLDDARVLDDVRAFLARFVAFPSDAALNAATLWAVHTHALQAFECTPRIALLSPEPGSGKTRGLEILELVVARPLLTVNVTPAYLFRKVADDAGPPTILYDEIDTVFGPRAKDNEDIRGMLNAGYRRGATAGRCVIRGKTVEVEELPAFAAVALAGLDDLPDTLMSRSIVVRMRRRAPHERIESYRRRVHEAEGHKLRDRLAAWAERHWPDLADAWPDLPDGIEDRDADVWEPLLAIADAAAGHWPDTARVAAVALVADARAKEGGLGIRLLADLREVFGGCERLATEEILTALCALDEAPWADLRGKALDARGLSRRLGKYDIHPKQMRQGERNVRGYDLADLADAWSRYLPADVADKSVEGEREIPPGGIGVEGATVTRPLSSAAATSATSATAGPGTAVSHVSQRVPDTADSPAPTADDETEKTCPQCEGPNQPLRDAAGYLCLTCSESVS